MSAMRRAWPWVACGLALAACGGSGSVESLGSARSFCAERTAAWAGKVSTCTALDREAAALAIAFESACAAVGRAEAQGTIAYDRVTAQTCLDAIAALPCDEVRTGGFEAIPAECAAATAPTVPPGGDCWTGRLGLECLGGWCEVDPLLCQYAGTCRAWLGPGAACLAGGRCLPGYYCGGVACQPQPGVQLAGEGAPCGIAGVFCAPGLRCPPGEAPTCAPLLASGPCFGDDWCATGTACLCADEACQARTCQPERRLGAPCTPGQRDCVRGLWCGPSGTCQRGAGLGDGCGGVAGESVACRDGWCDELGVLRTSGAPASAPTLPISANGTCRPFLPLGAACGELLTRATQLECGPGAVCAGGRCAVSTCGGGLLKY